MIKFFSNFKEGFFGTLILTFLFPFSNIFLLNLPSQLGIIDRIVPLYFLTFLLTPYLRKQSVLAGGFLGSIIYAILIKMPIILAVTLGIIFAITLLIYNQVFHKEPENKMHIFLNAFSLFLVSTFIAWLFSLTNSVFYSSSFIQYFNAYFYFGVTSSLVLVGLLTSLYGIKINAMTVRLRK